MTLTLGSGPFGHHPGGTFDFEASAPQHAIYFETFPRRVRGTGLPPRPYVPREDVRAEVLVPSEKTSVRCSRSRAPDDTTGQARV